MIEPSLGDELRVKRPAACFHHVLASPWMFTPEWSRAKGTQEIGLSGTVMEPPRSAAVCGKTLSVVEQPANRAEKAAAAANRMKDPTISSLSSAQAASSRREHSMKPSSKQS